MSLAQISKNNLETVNATELTDYMNKVLEEYVKIKDDLVQTSNALKYQGFDVKEIQDEIMKIAKDRNLSTKEVSEMMIDICMLAVMRGNNMQKVIDKSSGQVKDRLQKLKETWRIANIGVTLKPRTLTPVRISLAMWQISIGCAMVCTAPTISPEKMIQIINIFDIKMDGKWTFPKFVMTNAYTACSGNMLKNIHLLWLLLNNINIVNNGNMGQRPIYALHASWLQIKKFYEQAMSKPVTREVFLEETKKYYKTDFIGIAKQWEGVDRELGVIFQFDGANEDELARVMEIRDSWENKRMARPIQRRGRASPMDEI